jgi:tol-pal system protein YbgF
MRAIPLAVSVALAATLTLAAAPPAMAQDAAELTVRTNRLENQVRQLSGQIEQLQFENRRLADQLKRFQEDVEFRLGQQRPTGQAGQAAPASQPPAQRPRRNDAFDPTTQPAAPGASRQLGVIDDGAPGANQPLDISGAGRPLPQGALPPSGRDGPSVAATTATPRVAYDAAYAALQNRQFEEAEMGFRQFLQSNPRDRLAPNALYFLGESYFRRNRHRDAAEQYLKVTTEHQRANIAPDAMLRLGQSLAALGARDQACATFAQLEVRYPQASASVKQGVEREQRRARCDA